MLMFDCRQYLSRSISQVIIVKPQTTAWDKWSRCWRCILIHLQLVFPIFPTACEGSRGTVKGHSDNTGNCVHDCGLREMYPWHPLCLPLSLSLSSLLSTQSLAHPPVLSQLWGAATPLCQAAPVVGFPLWVRVTSGASIQTPVPSGMMPWSLFLVICGPLLMSTWLLPTCTSTTADQKSTPWTQFALFITVALPHTRTHTCTLTLMPTPGWTATPTGHRLTTTLPLTALTTSPTAGLSLRLCHLNLIWERAASLRRSWHLSPSLCPAGSSTPLTATERTRGNTPGSNVSVRSTRRRSEEEAPSTSH